VPHHRLELHLSGRGLNHRSHPHRIVVPPADQKGHLFRVNNCRQPLNLMVCQRGDHLCVSVWSDHDPKKRTCWREPLDIPWSGTRQLTRTHDRLYRNLVCTVQFTGVVHAPDPRPG
jgi:hypothetical protein